MGPSQSERVLHLTERFKTGVALTDRDEQQANSPSVQRPMTIKRVERPE